MPNLVSIFRSRPRSASRRLVLALWVVSTLNLFISPAVTLPEMEQTGLTTLQTAQAPETSVLESIFYLLYSTVNPNADLSDSVEDSVDKVEFIACSPSFLQHLAHGREITFIPPVERISHADLENTSPPPKVG